MDHFAKPDDELAIAQRSGNLYRNFQGYSTYADCDLVAMGTTSISLMDNTYAQNLKNLSDYYARIDANELAIFRGVQLTEDDELRRDVIMKLMSNLMLDFKALEQQWHIDFHAYFAAELQRLEEMAHDGLLQLTEMDLEVLPRGRLLIRNIAMVFDAYLQKSQAHFSKVI
jgi:oxygen-independent coproporphyrinogen-3 oxidase